MRRKALTYPRVRLYSMYTIDSQCAKTIPLGALYFLLIIKLGHGAFRSVLYSTERNQPAKHGLRLQAAINPYFALKYQKTGVHAAYSPSASLSACSALSEFNPQKPAFSCKQLSGWLLLSRYQKSPYLPLIFDEL